MTIMRGLKRRLQAGDHGAHVLVGGNADDHGLAIGRELGQILEGVAAELLGERRGLLGGAVPHAVEQTRAPQVASHVRAHGAESDEACLHTGSILELRSEVRPLA